MISTRKYKKYYANKFFRKKPDSKHYAHNRFFEKVLWNFFFVKSFLDILKNVQF
jgi:hypothetical protein